MKNDLMSKSLGEYPINYDNIYYDDNIIIDVPYNYIKPKDYPQGYMKVYINNSMARISFFGPYYIYAENGNYKLSDSEIAMLMDVLRKPYEYDKSLDIFHAAICMMNFGHHEDDFPPEGLSWKDIPEDLPIPDYTKLK